MPLVWGQYASAGSLDAEAAQAWFSAGGHKRDSGLAYAGTAFAWGGGRLIDAWPRATDEGEYDRVRVSEVETLLIGGALDTSTPPQVATRELLPYLPNGHQVVLPGIGHTASFFAEQPEAGSRLINTFLDSGRIDGSLYEPQTLDFTPALSLTTMAKITAVTIVALAVLSLLSVFVMARQVHRRGPFGRKAGAALRSVYAVVLGLGGWCFAVLLVLTTSAAVPLTGQLVAVPSIGLAVGLGTYLAWVSRDANYAGLVVAVFASLIGSWLGFHATSGLPALVTTLVGAVTTTNFALITLDIVWDLRQLPSYRTAAQPLRSALD
jgi:hypothetical protein